MEFDIIQAIPGLVSALGAVAVYRFNVAQSNKARSVLLEKLDQALAAESKHAACELFRMLYGLRMDYVDVRAVCENDKVSKIIHALQKTPGVVKHEGGRIQYTGLYKQTWVRRASRLTTKFAAYFFGLLTVALIAVMTVVEGAQSLAMLVFIIPCFAFLAAHIKELRHDRMVESLVEENEAC